MEVIKMKKSKNMKTKKILIAMSVLIVIFVTLLILWWAGFFENPYWETDTDLGTFQEEILVTYTDGTTKSLKLLEHYHTSPLSIIVTPDDEKEVMGVQYNLYAIATGSGFDSWDYKDWILKITLADIDNQEVIWAVDYSQTGTYETSYPSNGYDISYQLVYTVTDLDVALGDEPLGNYIIRWEPQGVFEYRGNPDGEWDSISLPAGRQIALSVQSGGTLSINFSDDCGTIVTVYTETESCDVVLQEYYTHGALYFSKINSGTAKEAVFVGIPIGTYMIIVTKDGFEAWETSIEITSTLILEVVNVPALTPIIGPCTPDCNNKECGSDGCGGSCGVCSPGYTCIDGICIQD
jgi:hypothetical protein